MFVTQRKAFVDYKDCLPTKYKSRPGNILLKKATIDYTTIIEKRCLAFKRDLLFIPRRTLTNPREPSKNDGYDNINDDYILVVNNYLGIEKKYQILDLMGQGTFGQVVKCKVQGTNELVAVKVIKRQAAFLYQGDKEIKILLKLKNRPKDKDKFLQLIDYFSFRGHTCAVLELLSISLHKLFSQVERKFKFSIRDIQIISFHILETLALLKEMGIIHTDLKPDNILLKSLDDIHNVKLIDYGSALMETEQLNYCVQTAFYRSPEVILHVPFNCAIDMWSFGCFIAEMFFCKPLFPSGDELVLLHMMTTLLGTLPSDHMLKQGKRTNNFFHFKSGTETKLRQVVSSHDKITLVEKIMGYESYDEDDKERQNLIDFLSKILVFDPSIRLSPKEALQHPFITSIHTNITTTNRPLSSISGVFTNNSSRTEESQEIKTPLHLQKDNLLRSPIKSPTKPPHIPSPKKDSPPKLKSILKKPVIDYQTIDNTLDSQIASFYPNNNNNNLGYYLNPKPFISPLLYNKSFGNNRI